MNKFEDVLTKVIGNFVSSKGFLKSHMFLSGASGSGKTSTVLNCVKKYNGVNPQKQIYFTHVTASQLTPEGTSGNSVSRMFAPLVNPNQKDNFHLIFVDEWDKLFMGCTDKDEYRARELASVQDEFLTALEGSVQVMGSYGAFTTANTYRCLFIFAGAYGGREDLNTKEFHNLGMRDELIGRVPLHYHLKKPGLEDLLKCLDESEVLKMYLKSEEYVKNVTKADKIVQDLKDYLKAAHSDNNLGYRVVDMAVHRLFINGSLDDTVSFKEDEDKINLFSNIAGATK